VVPNEAFVREIGYSREFLESAVSADVAAKTFIKNLTDTVNASDDAQVSNAKIESPTDGSSVTDQAVIGFGKGLTDSPTAADAAFRDFIKGLAETSTATDSAAKTAGKALIDSTSALDAGTVINQSYCDITYFAEDYVGTSVTF
jgi:cell division GTPase FtsZ